MALIIDGHNLIGTLPDMRLGDPDDEVRLLDRLRAYRSHNDGQPLIVFFDSGDLGSPTAPPELSSSGLQVKFSAPGETADDAILAFLKTRTQPGQYAVVTNDHDLATRARMAGASILPASTFAARLVRRPPPAPPRLPQGPDPHDPAFADIYADFVSAEKYEGRTASSRRDNEEAVDLWIERFYGDDIEEVKKAAFWLARHHGPGTLEILRDGLTHGDASVRTAVLLALGDLADRRALSDLSVCLLNDQASMAREAAAQSLARLGDRSVEAALRTAIEKDTKSKVRKAAQAALTQVRARQH